MIRIVDATEAALFVSRRNQQSTEVDAAVTPIIQTVREKGDRALLRYARSLDGLEDLALRVPEDELARAHASMSPQLCQAAETAIKNIREYARGKLTRENL